MEKICFGWSRIQITTKIKPTEYTNISYAFDPLEKTTETQIKLSQLKNSDKALQRSVDSEIKKGNIGVSLIFISLIVMVGLLVYKVI